MDRHPIFWVVDTGVAPCMIKILVLDAHDTIEDGQNKKSHLLLLFLVRIVLFLKFICRIYLSRRRFSIAFAITYFCNHHDHRDIGFPEFLKLFHSFSFTEPFNFVPKNVFDQKSISISNLCQAISILCHCILNFFHLSFWIRPILQWIVNRRSKFVICHSYSNFFFISIQTYRSLKATLYIR